MSNTSESAVRDRYAKAATAAEPALCCPVNYDARYLEAIPQEVLDRDYGCGDPSAHLKAGERVLDLGSGGGKICFIAAQVVGPEGSVVGVDMNDPMLELARGAQPKVAATLGYDNVVFEKARIQDMRLDLNALEGWVKEHPVKSLSELDALRSEEERLRTEAPLIPDNSVDVVVSNCVLNLVSDDQKRSLFREIYRVLRKGGRAIISDIVSDEPIPQRLKADPELWSGCISGAFLEREFLEAFVEAGFHGVELLEAGADPWQTVEGIEFRSFTVAAYKGKEGPCFEHLEAVRYKGPFSAVEDDDGHRFERGDRVAVCHKTFELLSSEPYGGHFDPILPREAVSDPKPFDCSGGKAKRDPRQTKGENYKASSTSSDSCGPSCC